MRQRQSGGRAREGAVQDAPARDEPESAIVSVDEAIALHPGEWIALRVTEENEYKQPSRGQVVAHNRSGARVWKAVGRLVRALQTGHRYYVFFGAPRGHTGEELGAALAKAWEEDGVDARRRW
jgi:hypothetical protein